MTKTRKTKPATGADCNIGTDVVNLDVNPTAKTSAEHELTAEAAPAASETPAGPTPTAKPPSKQQQLAALVVRDEGATLDQPVRDRYDDGGISGGTLERPGLQRLLADIASGHIDIVVVYKVDRLTRSLLDFARLVEAFDKAGTSFVSITQSFNTTTSMGRLTLNMLLSFAQFEREVTAERIRDKIAQSKARGMWMGGTPPIGYRPDGRNLAIVEQDAAIVRTIFTRYAALGNVRLLAEELEQQGIRSPARNAATSRAFGDRAFSRGQLYKILSNPTYIARIDHGGRSHKANFPAIIEQAQWDEVQTTLAANINGARGPAPAEASLLAGKLVDDRGVPMVAVHACKGNVRYRYYVSRDLHHGGDASSNEGWRLPAREIEPLVRTELIRLLRDPLELLAQISDQTIDPDTLARVRAHGIAVADSLNSNRTAAAKALRGLIAVVRLQRTKVSIELDSAAACHALGLQPSNKTLLVTVPATLKRSGHVMRLIMPSGAAAVPKAAPSLAKLVARGRLWWGELYDDPELTCSAIAQREGLTKTYISRVVRLAFLAPEVVKAIIEGTAPAHLTTHDLTVGDPLPADWNAQRRALAMPLPNTII